MTFNGWATGYEHVNREQTPEEEWREFTRMSGAALLVLGLATIVIAIVEAL